MSGETEIAPSGWTTDTLHATVQQRFTDLQAQMDRRAKEGHRTITDMRTLLDERYATQVKAVDAAFAAQQLATHAALAAAERAVATALLSAEKAVDKAEAAANKRFEGVNEFRGQLSDQANTFMPRSEAEQRINALAEKSAADTARNAAAIIELERRVTPRLDLSQGQEHGRVEDRLQQKANLQLSLAALTFLVFVVSVAFGIYAINHK
jgi:23S rRNA pseudoU1915 N3-methylase RlmH